MKTIKLLLLFILTMYSYLINAQPYPVVVPVYDNGSSRMSDKDMLAIFITLNLVCISIIIVRTIIWLLSKRSYSYKEYVWYSSYQFITPTATTFTLIAVNSIAIICSVIVFISNHL